MADSLKLTGRYFSGAERARLERFGNDSVASSRATHWHWATDASGSAVFEIYRGNDEQVLVTRISRERDADFRVHDVLDGRIANGALEQVLDRLDRYLAARPHGDDDDNPGPAA